MLLYVRRFFFFIAGNVILADALQLGSEPGDETDHSPHQLDVTVNEGLYSAVPLSSPHSCLSSIIFLTTGILSLRHIFRGAWGRSLRWRVCVTVQVLRQQLTEEEGRLSCRVCGRERAAVIFLPCSHLHLCADCARGRDNCSSCGAVVRGTIKPIISWWASRPPAPRRLSTTTNSGHKLLHTWWLCAVCGCDKCHGSMMFQIRQETKDDKEKESNKIRRSGSLSDVFVRSCCTARILSSSSFAASRCAECVGQPNMYTPRGEHL